MELVAVAHLQPQLSPASRRALDAFLAGRLPAGRLHEELTRASGRVEPEPPLVLPADTASIPVVRRVRHAAAPPIPRAA